MSCWLVGLQRNGKESDDSSGGRQRGGDRCCPCAVSRRGRSRRRLRSRSRSRRGGGGGGGTGRRGRNRRGRHIRRHHPTHGRHGPGDTVRRHRRSRPAHHRPRRPRGVEVLVRLRVDTRARGAVDRPHVFRLRVGGQRRRDRPVVPLAGHGAGVGHAAQGADVVEEGGGREACGERAGGRVGEVDCFVAEGGGGGGVGEGEREVGDGVDDAKVDPDEVGFADGVFGLGAERRCGGDSRDESRYSDKEGVQRLHI
ncbi:uncharacterized protein EV422DRAFT_512481 [Fimicolochytrium jonesii]|uniref:uncharacterized protein n=1 Tax=Fimicolochytrium jonesii TaxID=1396493 RepID=UPI0022FF3CCE|nr:uncharacterized protein EV422DRAFT_512481 [Fimicolochytrium jonesii]KAI8827052.1 hypothetical protein EV422DRAFT_512481 [Fimicolochytrium jonesii]